jgi:SSS family solute:Na+ symporter
MLGITIFGTSFFSKNRSTSAFTLGDSNIPAWVVTMSIFATFVSSISYLALPGSAYQSNWNAFVFSLSIPVATIMAVIFFVPLYRRINSPSAYTFIENRFGKWASIYTSICYLLTQLMRIATILYLLAITLNAIFNWSIPLIIIITGILIIIYSTLGGLKAVVWTDAIQAIILITGALVCVVFLIIKIPGGLNQIIDVANENKKFSLGSFNNSISESTFWIVFIYGIFINLQNFGIDQNYVQRYLAARNIREARISAFWGGIIYIPISFLFLFIGTSLYVYYHINNQSLPAFLLNSNSGDKIFPYFIVKELPVGISGLLVSSIFAAGMSTISTSFNSSATVFLTDYYYRFFNKSASDKQSLRALYIISLIIGILGILISLAMINVKSALEMWWKLASVFSGGMLGLFLLAAFTKIKNKYAVIIGVIFGILIILILSLRQFFNIQGLIYVHSYLSIVIGTTFIFLIGFLVSFILDKYKKIFIKA